MREPEMNGMTTFELGRSVTAATRRVIHTFDIFDTLIARRCIEAHAVFDDVESRSGVAGFAAARKEAERRVYHRDYTIADIYAGVRELLKLSDEQTEQLLHTEVMVELENVIPIAGMQRRLTQESVLITDMYLPLPVIRELLARAGIQRELPILISSHGKSSGATWRYFAEQGIQCIHHGDNEHSDVLNARQAGMRARFTPATRPTDFEALLIQRGAVHAARALRAARLQVDPDGLPEWLLRLQLNLNLPFLLVSVLDLLSQVREHGIERVLFASRDGRHLQAAFLALRDKFDDLLGVEARYWFTSRVARTRGSHDYVRYCQDLFQGRTAIVDLCGTGASITKLLRDQGLDAQQFLVYLAQKVSDRDYSNRMAQGYGLGTADDLIPVHSAFDTASYINNALIEELNYVPEGMVRDVMLTPSGVLPVRDTVDFEGDALKLVMQQNELLTRYFNVLSAELTPEALGELIAAVPAIHEWMLLHAYNLKGELEMLRRTLGVDDMSNEAFTQNDLFR